MGEMPGCSMKYSPVCIMHTCLRQPMRLCRWAGVFPVEGLNKRTCSELKFNLSSAYTVYLYLSLLGQFLLTSLSAHHFIIHDLSLIHLKHLVFYSTSTVTALFLVKLAANWPALIKRAWYIESRVVHIRTGNTRPENYTRIAYMVLILSLVEHLLSIFFEINLIMACRQDESMNLLLLEQLAVLKAKFLFEVTSFSHWKAILFEAVLMYAAVACGLKDLPCRILQKYLHHRRAYIYELVVNIQSTFLWNFTDAMTMCVSLYLTSYFRDLNKLIEQQQRLKNIRWDEMRLYYSDLVQLVQTVDSKTCYLILLSFFTNVFFICTQLFSLLSSKNSVVVNCHSGNVMISITGMQYYIIYYCYSSIFLFVRATITSLLAANVNTIAQKPFHIIQHVPTSEYTIEVQRFIRQTKHTTTALSGVFFDVTRGMILTVIGTIVKYELVLLQFSVKTYEAIH